MSEDRIIHKLTTVFYADVAGYSRLTGDDELGTHRVVMEVLDFAAQSIKDAGGMVLRYAGDAILAEFSSVISCVNTAVAVQSELGKRNLGTPEAQRVMIRIGINLGEVVVDRGEIYGDGVNLAARLEAAAQPGGICISAAVHDQIEGKIEIAMVDGGDASFKNITRLVRIHHWHPDGLTPDNSVESQPASPATDQHDSNIPKVAVTNFRVIGGDAEVSDLSQSLGEAIISGLAAMTALSVTRADADNKAPDADFLLEGSIRAAGNKVRATFLLRNQSSNAEIWSGRYDRTMEDLFDLEDEISQSVVSVLRIRLKTLKLEQLEATDDKELSVPDLLSKAAGYFIRSTGENDKIEKILDAVLEQSPDNSMAHAMMAMCRWRIHEYTPLAIDEDEIEAIQRLALRALTLDPKSYFAMLIAAIVQQDFFGDNRDALDQVESALDLNPNLTQAQATAGIAKCHLGIWDEGYEQLIRAIDANKDDPHRYRHLREQAMILYEAGRVDEASEIIRRLIQRAPDLCRNGLVSAGIYWQAGDKDRAQHCITELLARYPELNARNMRPINFDDEARGADFHNALLSAGLPEG